MPVTRKTETCMHMLYCCRNESPAYTRTTRCNRNAGGLQRCMYAGGTRQNKQCYYIPSFASTPKQSGKYSTAHVRNRQCSHCRCRKTCLRRHSASKSKTNCRFNQDMKLAPPAEKQDKLDIRASPPMQCPAAVPAPEPSAREKTTGTESLSDICLNEKVKSNKPSSPQDGNDAGETTNLR